MSDITAERPDYSKIKSRIISKLNGFLREYVYLDGCIDKKDEKEMFELRLLKEKIDLLLSVLNLQYFEKHETV
jgi:hypothetical protein